MSILNSNENFTNLECLQLQQPSWFYLWRFIFGRQIWWYFDKCRQTWREFHTSRYEYIVLCIWLEKIQQLKITWKNIKEKFTKCYFVKELVHNSVYNTWRKWLQLIQLKKQKKFFESSSNKLPTLLYLSLISFNLIQLVDK